MTVGAVTMSSSMSDGECSGETTTTVVDAEQVLPDVLPEEESVDGLPVLAEVRAIEPASRAALPAVQAAAVAATGFVAGAATVALVHRHAARKVARRTLGRRAVDALPIVGSRTFLVDVHLLAKPSE
jgi:hypothetical protein